VFIAVCLDFASYSQYIVNKQQSLELPVRNKDYLSILIFPDTLHLQDMGRAGIVYQNNGASNLPNRENTVNKGLIILLKVPVQ
jgi:hypothetical protein